MPKRWTILVITMTGSTIGIYCPTMKGQFYTIKNYCTFECPAGH